MVEANENPELVTMKRQRDLEESQQAYREQLSAQTTDCVPAGQTPALAVETAQTTTEQPETTASEDAHATFRHARLGIVALLVVVLLVVWFRQRRGNS